MNKKKLLLLFLITFIIPIAQSLTSYNQSGGADGDYQFGRGVFNANLAEFDTTTIVLDNNRNNIPLVVDLDENGVNEIIIQDGSFIRVFNANDLSEFVGLDLGTDEFTSNMIAFDIDNDNRSEIILALEVTEDMRIMEFNGTHLNNDTSYPIFPAETPVPQYMIGCSRPGGQCLIIAPSHVTTDANTDIEIGIFNYTNVSFQRNLDGSTGGGFKHCIPKIRNIVYKDYDNDGVQEFIFTTMEMVKAGNEVINIWYFSILGNGSLIEKMRIEDSSSGGDSINPFVSGVGADCRDEGSLFTSPLVHDFKLATSALETVVGMNINSEEFKMTSYKSNGDFIDDYPEVFEADGKLVSNPMLANAFTGSGNNDFCVVGYHDDDQEIDLLCANERNVETPESREFKFSTAELYNLTGSSTDYRDWSILSHAVQHSSATQTSSGSTSDLTEIINSYGVFELDWQTNFAIQAGANVKTLNRIFANPNDEGVLISVDARNLNVPNGLEDLIFLNANNLFYYDDTETNSPGIIDSFSVNPCIDSVWKVNTTVEVVIEVSDVDGNAISARAILYFNGLNEIDPGFSANVSSGTSIPFTFIANTTTTSPATLRIQGRDTANPTTLDTIDLTYSVGTNGVEFGDCKTEETVIPVAEAEEEDEATITEDADSNSLTNSVNTIISLTGLGGTTLWLFGMLVMTILVWFEMAQRNLSGNSALGTIAIMNVLAIVLGSRIGVFSVGMIVTLVVIGIVILGVFLGKFLMGKEQAQ